MKQIVLAAMVMMTVAGSASAEVSGWDYFWGTTLNPQNTGWDDFWYQCQDPNKNAGDCIGTIAAGIGAALVIPVAAAGLVLTGIGTLAGGATVAIGTAPATALYITASGSFVTVPAGGSIVGMVPAVAGASFLPL